MYDKYIIYLYITWNIFIFGEYLLEDGWFSCSRDSTNELIQAPKKWIQGDYRLDEQIQNEVIICTFWTIFNETFWAVFPLFVKLSHIISHWL